MPLRVDPKNPSVTVTAFGLKLKTLLQQQPEPFSSWSPNIHTDKHQILLFARTRARHQPADLIRDISASSIYKLCTVATHFIFSFFFLFPRVQYTGAWLSLYLCDGDISSMTWNPSMLSLQHGHTSSPRILMVFGECGEHLGEHRAIQHCIICGNLSTRASPF